MGGRKLEGEGKKDFPCKEHGTVYNGESSSIKGQIEKNLCFSRNKVCGGKIEPVKGETRWSPGKQVPHNTRRKKGKGGQLLLQNPPQTGEGGEDARQCLLEYAKRRQKRRETGTRNKQGKIQRLLRQGEQGLRLRQSKNGTRRV